MAVKEYFEKMMTFHKCILEYLEQEDDNEENYQNLINLFEDQKVSKNHYEMKAILSLLSKIIDYHHHESGFFPKIEQILLFFKKDLKKYFSQSEILNLFKNNKRVVLFLINSNILLVNNEFYSTISNDNYKLMEYLQYFAPEIRKLSITDEFIDSNEFSEDFEEKRKNGENDDYLAEIIRNDMVDDFILYTKQNNIPYNSIIKESIFETNLFLLLNRKTELIEYSAFFGSIKIFNYLHSNNVKLTPKIFIYAIHSNNHDFVKFLQNKISNEISYENCIKIAISCHHNQIFDYLQNFMNNEEFKTIIDSYALCFHNYLCFSNDNFDNQQLFFNACEFGHLKLVDLMLNVYKIDLEAKTIENTIFFSNKIPFILFK